MSLLKEYEIKQKMEENFGAMVWSILASPVYVFFGYDWADSLFVSFTTLFILSIVAFLRLIYYFIKMKLEDRDNEKEWAIMDIMDIMDT